MNSGKDKVLRADGNDGRDRALKADGRNHGDDRALKTDGKGGRAYGTWMRFNVLAGILLVVGLTAVLLIALMTEWKMFQPVSSVSVQGTPLVGERLYYQDRNAGGRLYSIRPDGTEARLEDDRAVTGYALGNGQVFTSAADGIRKLRSLGEAPVALTTSSAGILLWHDGWLYFTRENQPGIFRMCDSGGAVESIVDDQADRMRADDEWLYYRNNAMDNRLYKVRLDGTKPQALTAGAVGAFDIGRGFVCYAAISSQSHLFMLREGHPEGVLLYPTPIADVLVSGDRIYFSSWLGEAGLVRIALDGSGFEGLAEKTVQHLAADRDNLYYTKHAEGNGLFAMPVQGGLERMIR